MVSLSRSSVDLLRAALKARESALWGPDVGGSLGREAKAVTGVFDR